MHVPYQLLPLPYAYDALEPSIDARTMEIHYTKHHQAYLDNLLKALDKHPELKQRSVDELLRDLSSVPEDIRTAVQNNGGGHYNHTLFWAMLTPAKGQKPSQKLHDAILKKFGSWQQFVTLFNQAATSRFGSGWAWLVINKQGDVEVTSTANQDSPISSGAYPLLGLDVWEHAYYLKYQNKRVDYIQAFWDVVHWDYVTERFNAH